MIRFSTSSRTFTIYGNKNEDAGNFFVTLTATMTHPAFDPYSASIKIKFIILKGNLQAPDFENQIDTMIKVTAEKRKTIKLPKIKDIDRDSYKIKWFIENPVKSFVKVRGDDELSIAAKEEHEGNYNFGMAIIDINPQPL